MKHLIWFFLVSAPVLYANASTTLSYPRYDGLLFLAYQGHEKSDGILDYGNEKLKMRAKRLCQFLGQQDLVRYETQEQFKNAFVYLVNSEIELKKTYAYSQIEPEGKIYFWSYFSKLECR